MTAIPFFLERLQLDHDADERAIRRAYARELKLINQELDAAGFQSLRQCYEFATRWARHKAEHKEAAPASEVAASVPMAQESTAPISDALSSIDRPVGNSHNEEAGLNLSPHSFDVAGDLSLFKVPPTTHTIAPTIILVQPSQEAADVFADFMAAFGFMMKTSNSIDLDALEGILQASLNDDRLVGLEARKLFEKHIVSLLANGWQRGHEALLVAATDIFKWDKDAKRLGEFGYVGQVLNRAVEERIIFDHQAHTECDRQRLLISRLRDSAAPSQTEVLEKFQHIEVLARRFPSWLPLITNTNNIQVWRNRLVEVPNYQKLLAKQQAKKTSTPALSDKASKVWPFLLILFFVLKACFSGGTAASYHVPSHPIPSVELPEAAKRLPEILIPVSLSSQCHPSPPSKLPGATVERDVKLAFLIDVDGQVLEKKVLKESGSKAVDAAMLEEISQCKFTPQTRDGKPEKAWKVTRFTIHPPTKVMTAIVAPALLTSSSKECGVMHIPASLLVQTKSNSVGLKYLIDTNGELLEKKIVKSSGVAALDQLVLDSIAQCKFSPGLKNNAPAKLWGSFQYDWDIKKAVHAPDVVDPTTPPAEQ